MVMIETINPRGAINIKIVSGVIIVRGKYCLVDDQHNIIQIPEMEYQKLKEMEGMKDYGDSRIKKTRTCEL